MTSESTSARLFEGIASQDLSAVNAALAEGADLKSLDSEGKSLIVAAHRAMLRSKSSAAWDIISALVGAGFELSPSEALLVAPLTSQHQQWEPDFLEITNRLRQMFMEHQMNYLGPGIHFFTKWNGISAADLRVLQMGNSRAREVDDLRHQIVNRFDNALSTLQTLVVKAGFTLILDGRFMTTDDWYRMTRGDFRYRFRAHLFPTSNKYEAIAMIGLADWEASNSGSGPEVLIPELQAIESRWPFQIRSCTPESLELELQHPADDPEALIRALRSSFYIKQWNDDEEILRDANRLKGHRRFRFTIGGA